MATIKFKGAKEYASLLETLLKRSEATNGIIDLAVERGAKVVADTTRTYLESIPVDNRNYVEGKRDSILQVQKDDLISSFGLTPIQDENGFVNIKTGVDNSYNRLKQKNTTIARRLESGTSYMPKNPVFTRANNKSRKKAIEEMKKSIEDDILRIMKG